MNNEFWKQKTLEMMTPEEWESLCDGCALCCLYKLEDADTLEVYYTDVVCHYLDNTHCRCQEYKDRSILMPSCVQLTPAMVKQINWLPETCAYRLVSEGMDLYWWHPLISKNTETVHLVGVSVKNKAISDNEIDLDDLEDHVIDWVDF